MNAAYLSAWTALVTLGTGALMVEMIGHNCRAHFLLQLRPVLRSSQRLIPLCALLYIPVLWRAELIYPWVPGGVPPHDAQVLSKVDGWYDMFGLGGGGLALRSAVYFAVLIGLWMLLRRAPKRMLARISAVGIFVVGVTWTFCATDWWMAFHASWVSTIYPVVKLSGGFCAAVAVAALGIQERAQDAEVVRRQRHAMGRLLLASVCFWAYLSYCEVLLIWIADLPHENGYLLVRLQGGFAWLSLATALTHFALPFLILLRRDTKTSKRFLGSAAALVLVGHVLASLLTVLPEQQTAFALASFQLLTWGVAVLAILGCLRYKPVPPLALSESIDAREARPIEDRASRPAELIDCQRSPSRTHEVALLQASDQLNSKRIAIVTAISLALGAAAVAFSGAWAPKPDKLGESPLREPASQADPLRTRAFSKTSAKKKAPAQKVDRYRWLDREVGLAQVPVARAQELLLAKPRDKRWKWLDGPKPQSQEREGQTP